MINYIATFFSHFGALRFHKLCQSNGWQSQVRPVPRDLSSSCGTCVFFCADALVGGEIKELITPELEQIVCSDNGYRVIYITEE